MANELARRNILCIPESYRSGSEHTVLMGDLMKTRQPASFDLIHQVRFRFRHVAVLHAIEQEIQQSFRERHIIPNKHWSLEESDEYGECWAIFSNDDPFDPAELEQCRANIELMDAACEAMIRGTKAEKELGHFDVSCPYCRAKPGEPCKTEEGRRAQFTHTARAEVLGKAKT